jgi:hypothetical protein
MAIKSGLLTAVLIVLSTSTVWACDDFDEEMAMQAAREATKPTQTAEAQQAPATPAAGPAMGQAEVQSLAAVEPRPAPAVTASDVAGAVAR